MARTVYLPTTEDHIWIFLPFRIRESGLARRQADRLAIGFRIRGHLARVCRDRGHRYFVATHYPRRYAPRSCDL